MKELRGMYTRAAWKKTKNQNLIKALELITETESTEHLFNIFYLAPGNKMC